MLHKTLKEERKIMKMAVSLGFSLVLLFFVFACLALFCVLSIQSKTRQAKTQNVLRFRLSCFALFWLVLLCFVFACLALLCVLGIQSKTRQAKTQNVLGVSFILFCFVLLVLLCFMCLAYKAKQDKRKPKMSFFLPSRWSPRVCYPT